MTERQKEECSKHGEVVSVVLPRPHPPNEPMRPADDHIGKIFVVFKTREGAAAAKVRRRGGSSRTSAGWRGRGWRGQGGRS
eukprot:749752-Hanusia_phi.AAC.1